MSSLNLDLNYFDHVKAMRMEARLGHGADVLPIRLWAYVGNHYPDAGRVAMLEEELERVCRWWGEKGAMVAAMLEIGLIHKRDNNFYEIHDWLDHNGHLSAYKKRAKKAARKRWGMLDDASSNAKNNPSNAKGAPKQSPDVTVLDVHDVTEREVKPTALPPPLKSPPPKAALRSAPPDAPAPLRAAVIQAGDERPEYDHQAFLAAALRSSQQPQDPFAWSRLESSLTDIERIQSKTRERLYNEPPVPAAANGGGNGDDEFF